ncbi:MAG: ABC transporter permease [Nanoarchaeota archaeon]
MAYADYIGLVFKDIKNRKFSSLLTLIAISLGIMAIFVIILVSEGFENSIEKQFEQLGGNKLYVSAATTSFTSASQTKGLTDDEVDLIESRAYIEKAYPYYFRSVQVQYGNEFKRGMVLGSIINQDFFDEFNIDVREGRIPKSNEKTSVVIGPKVAEDYFGKDVRIGSNIVINEQKYKVVGILESLGNPEDDRNIYVNIDTIRESYGEDDEVNLAKENLQIVLENKLGKDSVEVITQAQVLEQFNNILDIVQLTLGGIALVSLIVGGVGIVNTMYVIVTEKTKEIGIMKAIGARNSDVFFIYVFQAGVFGFLGGVIGIIFGTFAALGFEVWAKSFGFEFLEITIHLWLVIALLAFSFLVGAISGFLPAKQASSLKIVDTLRK